MKKTREKRLRTLEARARIRPPVVFCYGPIRYLPPDTSGERHIAIVKSEPTALPNVQQCEFEQRVGPAPWAHDDLSFQVYLSTKTGTFNSR